VATIGLLKQWGLGVVSCKSGEEVESVLDDGSAPDLALVDLRLETVDEAGFTGAVEKRAACLPVRDRPLTAAFGPVSAICA
jgi:DNA-binding NtrC family response regulator